MSQQDKIVKCVLFLGFCVLLVDKIMISSRSQSPTIFEPNQADENAIRNSMPTNEALTATQLPAVWNLLMPVRQVVSWARKTTSSQSGHISRILNNLVTWFARVTSPTGHHRKNNTTSSGPSEPRLEATFDEQSSDGKSAYHESQINGIDIAYNNPFPTTKLRGVALLIHGCQQQASDWFQLPEHRHIAAQLLRKRLALLAVTSGNRVTGCWSTRYPDWQNDDVARVVIATQQWLADNGIPPKTPLYAVGISSGATMLSVLSSSNKLPGLISQALYISPGNQRAFRNATESYPNTLFVHVMTDHHYASPSAIASARKTLLKRNVGLVGELPLSKVNLTPLTLHEREPRFTPELSRKMFAAAEQERGNMERAMRMSTDEGIATLWTTRDSRRAARQIIRVVNGYHEVSAMYADKVADWLVSNERGRTKTTSSWRGLSLQ